MVKCLQEFAAFLDESQLEVDSDGEVDEEVAHFDSAGQIANDTIQAMQLLLCVDNKVVTGKHLAAADSLQSILSTKQLNGVRTQRPHFVLASELWANPPHHPTMSWRPCSQTIEFLCRSTSPWLRIT